MVTRMKKKNFNLKAGNPDHKAMRWKWHRLSRVSHREKFLVTRDYPDHQLIIIDVDCSKGLTAHVHIVLVGPKSRINFDLVDHLDRMIRKRGCAGMTVSFDRGGVRPKKNSKINF